MAGVLLYENPTRDIYHRKREFPADVHEQIKKLPEKTRGLLFFKATTTLEPVSLFLKVRDEMMEV